MASLTHLAPAVVDIFRSNHDSPSPEECTFKNGSSYMVKEEKAYFSYKAFTQLASKRNGLIITRIHPPRLKKQYNISGEILWLSTLDADNIIKPNDLNKLGYIINSFIENHCDGCIILLDGIEYLILHDGFEKVLTFISYITDKISQSKAILLIPTSPKALTQKEVTVLERKLETCQ
ncbi:MAG: DUF835 domain-containing protein [Theionarchaea archaeon]|nr:DUF835 domain-containing protein [Theionarchaea archaeon]